MRRHFSICAEALLRLSLWNRIGLVATLLAMPGTDPAGAEKAPAFNDSTTVVVVEVPVNVHLDGQAVRGLTQENFEIREGRRSRQLVGFEVIDLAVGTARTTVKPAPEAGDVPMAARRHFLLFFDLTTGGLAGLQGARDLVESGLHTQDLVGVGVYGRAGAGLLLGFTSDHAQALAVLDRLENGTALEPGSDPTEPPKNTAASRRDPLRLMPDTRAIDIAREALEMDTGGRGSNAEVYFEMNRSNVSQGRSRARAEIGRFSKALGKLADATARLDGRKFLVLFSAGFDDDVFLEEETLTRRSLLDSRQGSSALRSLQRMTDRFRQAGWAIQSVDSAGLQEGRGLSGGTSLALLANETGGETYRHFNNLSRAMDQMLEKTSVTYLLAFQTDDVAIDGAFHKIKIQLRDGPRGARLNHRPGYYAPKPYDPEGQDAELDSTADRFSTAEMLLSGNTSGSLKISSQAAGFRGDTGTKTYAWLEISGLEKAVSHPKSSKDSKKPLQVEIFAYAFAGERAVDFSTRTLSLDPSQVGDRLRAGGLRALVDLELSPGSYDLRLLVRESRSGLHALTRTILEVPPASAETAVLLPPFLIDDTLKGVIVRPQSDAQERAGYPFVAGPSEAFVPAVDPDLNAGQKVRICLMGYHLTRPGLTLNVDLYDVTDQPAGELIDPPRIELLGRSDTSAQGLDRLYLHLTTAGLADGRYELRASIQGPDGSSQVVTSPFSIAG